VNIPQTSLLLAVILFTSLQAEPPKLNVIHPLAIEKGVTQKVLIRGLNLPEDTRIHFGENEHKILRCFHSRKSTPPPNQMNKEMTGDTQFILELTVPHSFSGNYLPLYLETPEGKTKTVSLQVVSRLEQEQDTDGSFEKAILLQPGEPVHGSIHKNQDVDTYRISAKAGQTLRAEIQANTIASALDSFLYLYDSKYRILASNDDSNQRDSLLELCIPEDGDYYLTVLDAHDFGDAVLHPYLLVTDLKNPRPPDILQDFPGGNIEVVELDVLNRSLRFRPAKHKDRGWDCWWYFRMEGMQKGQTWTFQLEGSGFTTPRQATYSTDNKFWQQTEEGKKDKNLISYSLKTPSETLWLAWGPPFQLEQAELLVNEITSMNVGAESIVLTTSKDGHKVPGLHWKHNGGKEVPAVWIQARQHAWESGSSWVCKGLTRWLASGDKDAEWMRDHASIYIIPIMDVDNVQRGAGGKNQIPHDHNRDWGEEPIHPEAGDRKPFFFGSPEDHVPPQRASNQSQFLKICEKHLGEQRLGFNSILRITGANYHPLWKRISKNWVARNTQNGSICLTLETSWDTPNSTQANYQEYGAALGRSISQFLQK
jgi:hypothetical protein